MSCNREKLDGSGIIHRGRKHVKWRKRQLAKYRRRLGKKMRDLPPTAKLTKGYES